MATEPQHRVESTLEGLETELLETSDLALGEVGETEFCEGRTAPKAQGSLERDERRCRVVLERAPPLRGERLETARIDCLRGNAQHVAGRLGDDRSVRAQNAT